MNTFALEIWYDEGAACSFYTVRVGDDDESPSETDKFFDKYTALGHPFEDEAYQLFRLVTKSIGERYGAIDDFFDRYENQAQALPPRPKQRVEEIAKLGIRFPLRLYCFRITAQIVVLFNGGVKDAATAQDSKSLSMKFQEAQTFVRKIEEALQSGMIVLSDDGRHLKSFNETTELYL